MMRKISVLKRSLFFLAISFLAVGHSELPQSSLPTQQQPFPAVAEARGGERCQLPGRWEGNWFQSGVHQTITINSTSISTKGKCIESDGDKFLVYNEKDNCYRCVVFHEKHLNVLQYKETFCIKDRRSLRSVCSTITGDANLFSMFRLDGVPIECPFKGPYTFTYNRGHGNCSYPQSTIDSCINPSRQLLNFQACPDVPGTESTVEELLCLAAWKEGSSRYLLGLITYRHHASYEERFRCFVYEKSKNGGVFSTPPIKVSTTVVGGGNSNLLGGGGDTGGGSRTAVAALTQEAQSDGVLMRLSQSGDATCNGLSALEGSRIMILRKAPPQPKCQFPSWIQVHAQWHTLDQKYTFAFDSNTLRVTNSASELGPSTLTMTATCHHLKDNPTLDRVHVVMHVIEDCQNGYKCATIYKRDGHIVEMQIGNLARRPDDACHIYYFNNTQLPYTTLVSATPETRQCPNLGQFVVTGLKSVGGAEQKCPSVLRVGCNSLDTLQLHSSSCPDNQNNQNNQNLLAGLFRSEYACHGWWEEMGLSYLITTPLSRTSSSARRYCFVFRETWEPVSSQFTKKKKLSFFDQEEGGTNAEDTADSGNRRVLHFSSIADSCRRNITPGLEGTIAFNVTSQGRCEDISGAERRKYSCVSLFLVIPLFLLRLQ